MRIQKISISFSKYSDADFLNKAEHILQSMNNNSDFPNPVPTIAELQAAVTKYSTDLVAAAGLGRNNVAEKNKSRQALESIISQLGMFVMFSANGDAAILTRSGYTLTREPEPVYIGNPGNVTISSGITSGELVGTIKSTGGAVGYLHQICEEQPTEATVWNSTPSSKSKFVYKNLLPGKQYWVRVAAVGRGEQLAYSPVSSQYAQ
jgi:hypothetical protein